MAPRRYQYIVKKFPEAGSSLTVRSNVAQSLSRSARGKCRLVAVYSTQTSEVTWLRLPWHIVSTSCSAKWQQRFAETCCPHL